MRDRSVVKLSVTPSTKYSCCGSPDILVNGRTTIDRRGGRCISGWDALGAAAPCATALPIAPMRMTQGTSASQPRCAAKPPNSMIGMPSPRLPTRSIRYP
jgi:hypothetical protein